MKKPVNFEVTFAELKSVSEYLNKLIEDGSFYQLPFRERYRHIRHINKLYTRMRGPLSDVSLKRILAASALAAFIIPIKIGPGIIFTPGSLLVGCTINTSSEARTYVKSQLDLALAPVTLASFELTITADDMETIQETYTGDTTEISIEVPSGEARLFELAAIVDPAERSSIMRYLGSSTLDLTTGETVELELTMDPDPIDPVFAPAVQNPFGISGLFNRGAPVLTDLDGDGDLDLIVGDYYNSPPYYGAILQYFENTGTQDSPAFATVIPNAFISGFSFLFYDIFPAIGDLDTDGDLDIMMGIDELYPPAFFQYLENTGTGTSPSFSAPPLSNQFGLTNSGSYYAYTTFGDMDGDGDLDLLVGAYANYYPYYSGLFQYYPNDGTPSTPNFGAPIPNPFGITGVTDKAFPALVDLNGDGDLDILAGDQSGNFNYFENTGTPGAPVFAAPVQNPFGLSSIIVDAVPTWGDIDGDGDLDLIVGSGSDTNIRYFENQAIP